MSAKSPRNFLCNPTENKLTDVGNNNIIVIMMTTFKGLALHGNPPQSYRASPAIWHSAPCDIARQPMSQLSTPILTERPNRETYSLKLLLDSKTSLP